MKSHANIPQAGTSHIERYQADTKIMLALLTVAAFHGLVCLQNICNFALMCTEG